MKTSSTPKEKAIHRTPKETPAVIYLWAIVLGAIGYVASRFLLSTSPHPYHWLSLLGGVLLGIPVGWLWYRWRGDIKI